MTPILICEPGATGLPDWPLGALDAPLSWPRDGSPRALLERLRPRLRATRAARREVVLVAGDAITWARRLALTRALCRALRGGGPARLTLCGRTRDERRAMQVLASVLETHAPRDVEVVTGPLPLALPPLALHRPHAAAPSPGAVAA